MASLTDAFNDAFGEENAIVKFVVYAIPVFLCAYLYLSNSRFGCYTLAIPTALLLLTLMTNGINNIRSNKREILTLNPVLLISVLIKLFFAVVPVFCIMTFIGYLIITLIFNCIVFLIVFSVIFTSYLSFSKTLSIEAGYNLKVISESAMDVLICLLFLIPQLIIANGIIIGIVWYLFFVFHLPINNPLFIFYCSAVLVFNISALAGYFAQASYELIRGKDDEYKDNYYMKGPTDYTNKRK